MARQGKIPFIKPNFKKVPQVEELNDDEEDIREIIVEHKSGFNTIKVLVLVLVAIAFGFVVGTGVSFFKQEYKGEKISNSLQELIAVYNNIMDSYYEDIDEQDLVNETVDRSYDGIGITITQNENKDILIVSVAEDSPAEKADIQSGDILLKINKKSLSGLSLDKVTEIIKGTKDKTFNLTIKRGEEELTKKVTSETIDLVSVTSKVYPLNNGNAGYISINTFAANTYKQFKKELNRLEKKNINSLIIDVRSNPGGHLSQTRDILELFMKKGSVLYQVQYKKEVRKIKDETKASRTYPVVVLINSSSASASEILAASFKDSYVDATLIGEKTYGKGTVQTAYSLSDGSSLKYTTEKWLTPKGKWIDGKGVSPDKNVLLTDEYLLNPTTENDLQLQSALEFLEKERNTSEN